ncbi:MAG: hypothetical protein ACK52I_03585 [Pseudomonadota bacterium]|jgi:hypothetical protein
MSDDQSASGATDESSAQNQTDDKSKAVSNSEDKVSYDTYKKTISQVKKLQAELKAREDLLEQEKQKTLEAEGNKDELISQLKSKVSELEKKTKETINSFAYVSLEAQVKAEAVKAGCIDPEAVMKLADLSEVEVDPKTFRADGDAVTSVLEALKKDRPYLFSKGGPKINSQVPINKGGGEQKSYKDMSTDELWKELKRLKQ